MAQTVKELPQNGSPAKGLSVQKYSMNITKWRNSHKDKNKVLCRLPAVGIAYSENKLAIVRSY
jgi:hypothetical protein